MNVEPARKPYREPAHVPAYTSLLRTHGLAPRDVLLYGLLLVRQRPDATIDHNALATELTVTRRCVELSLAKLEKAGLMRRLERRPWEGARYAVVRPVE